MTRSPEVLLLDDGELEDVQEILADLQTSYGRIRGGAITRDTPPPQKLLVTTPRRIEAVDLRNAEAVVRVVVVEEDSPTLRAHLRSAGCDYLVRRPVHPQALRLLLMRCLFRGDERRNQERVAVGVQVSFRTGLLARRAILVDLSTSGCRILSRRAIPVGRRIHVTIPPHARQGDAVSIQGTVVRIGLDEHLGPDGPYSAAIAFDTEIPVDVCNELAWIVEDRFRGPATLDAGLDRTFREESFAAQNPGETRVANPTLHPPETRATVVAREVRVEIDVQLESEEDPGAGRSAVEMPDHRERSQATGSGDRAETLQRRRNPRRAYFEEVSAFVDRATRVLVARDLSMGGMRIEHAPGLELGDRVHLAMYASAHEEPFLVWATVDREDGAAGSMLRFDPLPAPVAEKLDKLVASLPSVESLHDEEARAMGTVVTEILPN